MRMENLQPCYQIRSFWNDTQISEPTEWPFFQWFSTTFFSYPEKISNFFGSKPYDLISFLGPMKQHLELKIFHVQDVLKRECPSCIVHVVLAAMVQNQGVLLLMVQKSSTRLRLVVYPSIYYRVLYIPGGWHLVYIHSISRLHKFGGITPSKNALFARFFGQQIVFIVRKIQQVHTLKLT